MLSVVCLTAALAAAVSPSKSIHQEPGSDPPARVVVAQDGSGDVQGTDHRALIEAIERLGPDGGTVLVRPGRYWSRHTVFLPSGVRLEGESGAVLATPSPKRVAADAASGATRLELSDTVGLAPNTALQLLPPEDLATFDGLSEMIPFVLVTAVDATGVDLDRPLPFDVPAKSRFGYPFKMIWAGETENVEVVGLTFDGGKDDSIPMPGHHQRTAVWIDSIYSKREGPMEGHPPNADASVRGCTFRNLYGRGVACYNAVRCEVLACRFAHVADEAIDFDHYCFDCRAVGNEIEDALWGVALNDASRCLVADNHLWGCDVGITIWWLPAVPPEGLNEENEVRGNFVYGSREALTVLKNAHRNVLVDNVLEGAFVVHEEDNQVEGNDHLGSGR